MAARLLKNAAPNRNVDIDDVRKYAADMAAGRWNRRTDIFLNEEERMVDGQNRCLAVIETGVSIPVSISIVNKETLRTIDTGKARTMSHFLQMDEYTYASDLASAINGALTLYGLVEHGKYRNPPKTGGIATRTYVVHEKYEILEKHPTLHESVVAVAHISGGSTVSRVPKGWLGVIRDVASSVDAADEFDAFVSSVTIGDKLSQESPEFMLRRRLLQTKSNPAMKLPVSTRNGLWVKAWNQSYMNEETTMLKVSPKVFPLPIGIEEWVRT